MATVETDELFAGFILAGDTGLAAATSAETWAVPITGGVPGRLAQPGSRLARVETNGAYGWRLNPPAFNIFEMKIAPIDGTAALAFLPPRRVVPEHIWASGSGGSGQARLTHPVDAPRWRSGRVGASRS